MCHHGSNVAYPIKINLQITSDQKLEEEAKTCYNQYFNNQQVEEETADIVYIPYHETKEFFDRYNALIDEFNLRTSKLENKH